MTTQQGYCFDITEDKPIPPKPKGRGAITIRINVMLKDLGQKTGGPPDFKKIRNKIIEVLNDPDKLFGEASKEEIAGKAIQNWRCFHKKDGTPLDLFQYWKDKQQSTTPNRWSDWNDFCWSDWDG